MFRSLLIFVAFGTPALAFAQRTVISEDALNFFAQGVGPITHIESKDIKIYIPSPCDAIFATDPIMRALCRQQNPPREIVLASGTLHWDIQASRFVVSKTGVRFKAVLQAYFEGARFYRNVDLPVVLTFNADAGKLSFKVVQDAIPIDMPLPTLSSTVTLAHVSPGQFYSTDFPLQTRSFTFSLPQGARTLRARTTAMQVVYLDKKIELKPTIRVD
jgi:hypothetical protein